MGNNVQQQGQKGRSLKDVYQRLETIENKVEASREVQESAIVFTLAAAVIFLALGHWDGFLEAIGMDATGFYKTVPFFIALGFLAILGHRFLLQKRRKGKTK